MHLENTVWCFKGKRTSLCWFILIICYDGHHFEAIVSCGGEFQVCTPKSWQAIWQSNLGRVHVCECECEYLAWDLIQDSSMVGDMVGSPTHNLLDHREDVWTALHFRPDRSTRNSKSMRKMFPLRFYWPRFDWNRFFLLFYSPSLRNCIMNQDKLWSELWPRLSTSGVTAPLLWLHISSCDAALSK